MLGPSVRKEVPEGAPPVYQAERRGESQRESEQGQKSAGVGDNVRRGGSGRPKPRLGRAGPGTHLPAPRPAASRAGCRRAGGRARRSQAGLCQEESLPGRRGSPGGAMRRMSARSPAGGTSRARAAAAAPSAACAPRAGHAPATPPPRGARSP